MKIKTADLIDTPLDWAVAQCLGVTPVAVKKNYSEGWLLYSHPSATVPLEYSSRWAQGGPIIERECMDILCLAGGDDGWQADKYLHTEQVIRFGPTPLIAAMRCFVASRLGDEVDISEELLK